MYNYTVQLIRHFFCYPTESLISLEEPEKASVSPSEGPYRSAGMPAHRYTESLTEALETPAKRKLSDDYYVAVTDGFCPSCDKELDNFCYLSDQCEHCGAYVG